MTVIRVVDSSTPPTAAQVAEAKAAGYQAWFGYIGAAGDNELRPWTQADFAVVTSGGLLTGAYCSGRDDPTWVKQTAAAWGIHVLVLDDETGIKADGSWVAGWCQTAGAGLYGDREVIQAHINDPVPFFVLAAYPNGSDTQTACWSISEAGCAPSKPTGWQWAGTRPMFGMVVDLANYDSTIFNMAAPGVPQEGDDSVRYIFWAKAPNGQTAAFLSVDSMFFRWIETPDELDAITKATLAGKVETWNAGAPVAEVKAFGTPANKATADLLGIAFP